MHENQNFDRAAKTSPNKQNKESGISVPSNQNNSKLNGKSQINLDTNLSKQEILGMRSLNERVAKGEIIVAETDKSKKFAILSRKQYLESGLVHTKDDIEISPDRVKRVQNYVNDHVNWLRVITNIGENWGHSDRMKRNLCDKGEQTCLMSLLIKNHKS